MKEIEGEDRGRMMKDALASIEEGCTLLWRMKDDELFFGR